MFVPFFIPNILVISVIVAISINLIQIFTPFYLFVPFSVPKILVISVIVAISINLIEIFTPLFVYLFRSSPGKYWLFL